MFVFQPYLNLQFVSLIVRLADEERHFPLDLNSGAMESSDGDEDGMLFLLRNLVTLEDLWNP